MEASPSSDSYILAKNIQENLVMTWLIQKDLKLGPE